MRTMHKFCWLAIAITHISLIFSHNVVFSEPYPAGSDDKVSGHVHYALDPEMTRRLVLLEDKLYIKLTGVWESIEESSTEDKNKCFIWLSTYLNEFEEEIKPSRGVIGKRRSITVVDNPILIFKMIRRIFSTILNNTVPMCNMENETSVRKIVEDVFKQSKLMPPKEQDWNEALLGLLRIQYFYGFDAITQLRLGILNDTHTNVTLWFDDCMALARRALKMEAEVITFQWLTSASLCLKEKKFTDHQSLPDLESELKVEWENLMKLVNVETIGGLDSLLKNKQQKKMKPFQEYEGYSDCRGESIRRTNSKLICFNQRFWDPYFMINPVKTEILSDNPRLYQFYDFIGEKAMKHIKESTAQIMQSGINIPVGDNSRTSLTSFQDPNNLDPIMMTLSRKIEKMTGFDVVKNLSSELQIALYSSMGGHYGFHHDSLQPSGISLGIAGDRIASFLMFISDVKMGGYTVFPYIGVFVKPVKRSALFWYNLHSNGKPDLRMVHAGCPVVSGTKLVVNRWIYQYENMWNYPCVA